MLRIGVPGYSPAWFTADIHWILTELTRQKHISGYELTRLSDPYPLQQLGQFDAIYTSTSFHPSLPQESAFFGGLSFGLPKNEKFEWLTCPQALNLQARWAQKFGSFVTPVSVNSDSYGFFVRGGPDSLDDLVGKRIPVLDSRGIWWQALGASIHKTDFFGSVRGFVQGDFDTTVILSTRTYAELLTATQQHLGDGISYVHTSQLRTGISSHLFWNVESFTAFGHELQPAILAAGRSAHQAMTTDKNQQDQNHLEQISRGGIPVATLSDRVHERLRDFSLAMREKIASQSDLSSEIAKAYSEFERTHLNGRQFRLIQG